MTDQDKSYGWSCPEDINLSSDQDHRIGELHRRGILRGDVSVAAADNPRSYAKRIASGRAEIRVCGGVAGEVFIRWDGAWRYRDQPYATHPLT